MSVTIHDDMLEAAQLYEDGAGLIYALICWAELGQEPDRSAPWYPTFVALKERARLSREAHVNGRKGGRPKSGNQGIETPGYKPTDTNPDKPKTETRGSSLSRVEKSREEGSRGKNFTPPTVQEVRDYVVSIGSTIDPEAFVDYYTSKGWKVGSSKMKDWKSAVRNWQRRESPKVAPIHSIYDQGVIAI